jgi:transcriptional regulator with XRE-family HTH domain
MQNLNKRVGLAIRRLRWQRGMSQQALANKARLARTYVTGVETGNRNLTLKTMARLAESLEVDVGEFFYGTAQSDTATTPVSDDVANDSPSILLTRVDMST